ncbi:OmpA-OmpF porin, OOP family [Mesonia phycicola]|uniref:OmpA-OmpF porin, OOP family n=1 Tax=Mesonia phycicola TaxID=579105 RepID=A0A1M6H2F0_9FLAO|nr:OmpA family protein [Mesonia phycicola]SHJ16322.1 OmpA-OmpF porin, OOP family [Mesonia phycicola]
MKKITFLLFSALIGLTMQAQEEEKETGYNKWSIDVGGGLNESSRPYAEGYYSPTFGAWNADLGVRYMFNDKFGLKANAGINDISEGEGVPEFSTQFYRASIEGVLNLGSILNFREWTNRINLLAHGGGGMAMIKFDDATFDDDYMTIVTAGITPQVRLSNRIALYADLSIVGNINQNYTWDGQEETENLGFDGLLTNASIGINVYLGKHKTHADWVDKSENTELKKELDSIQDRVAKLEEDLRDEDQDGVPNYLDREPNTMNGVAVDSKGFAVDKNENGIPDEIESSLDQRYTSKQEFAESKENFDIKKLLNDGYVNVYFPLNSDKPHTYSLEAINYVITYMRENPSVKAELIGYADELGNAAYNEELSNRRAERVYNIVIASGIDASRLKHVGNGVDSSVDKTSAEARQLVRRVTFKIK